MNNIISKLANSIGQYKKDTILSPIFMVFEVSMEVFIPFLMAKLIDNGIEKGDLSTIIKLGIVLVLSALISLSFGMLSGYFGAKASAGFAKNLRQKMYYAVQDFSFFNIDKFSTPSLVTRLTTDVANVQNAFQMIIRVAVRGPVLLIFALIMSISINHELSYVFLWIIPFLAIGLLLIIKNVHPIFRRVFKTYDKLNMVVQENLRGIRVVKSFVREEHEKKKFNAVSRHIYKDFIKAENIIALNAPLMQFSMFTCILLVSWIGAKMIVSQTMTTGELVSLFTYIFQVLISLMLLSMVFVMIIISRASAMRIAELLDEKSDIKNPPNPIKIIKNGDVVFKNVSFSYAKDMNSLCLKDVNLDIKSGEMVGIIGGTGSSKTTLIQLVSRLYDVTRGQVLVGGIDVRNYDLHALRDQVAVVLQKNELFSGTIKDNLRWGNKEATDEELINACQSAQADTFIRSLPNGYDTHIEQGGLNISGGQKQRLCIARALLKKPKILILDDSTSAVDMKTDSLIQEAFRKEIPEVTKLIIAQRIASIIEADKIIVMDNGRIDAVGKHEELINTNTIYKEVYNLQMNLKNGYDEK